MGLTEVGIIPCPHWSAGPEEGRGTCAIGKYGGTPRLSVCRVCLVHPKFKPGERAVSLTTSHTPLFHALWREIHTQKGWTVKWLNSVYKRLPCGECKSHFREYWKAHPVPFGDDEACAAWADTLHAAINKRLGKPEWKPECPA